MAVVNGEVRMGLFNTPTVLGQIRSGSLKALAVTSEKRSSLLPDLPTMIEAGVPDYVVTSFFGVVAPAGTPAPIVARLNAVINDALKSEAVQSSMARLGAAPTIETPEAFGAFIAAEMHKWTEIAKAAGISID
jgi:tripartite-type tricarboxylate transporter receptor subunit TctC